MRRDESGRGGSRRHGLKQQWTIKLAVNMIAILILTART